MPLTEEERKERANVNCCQCGKGIYRKPSDLKRSKNCYCSRNCHSLAMRVYVTDSERRDARNLSQKKYIEQNKPKIAARMKKYRRSDKGRAVKDAYLESNKDRIAAARRAYFQSNKEMVTKANKEWRDKNREHSRISSRKRQQKQRDSLADCYVMKQICQHSSLCAADIPQSLIKAKRAELKFNRIIKEQENG